MRCRCQSEEGSVSQAGHDLMSYAVISITLSAAAFVPARALPAYAPVPMGPGWDGPLPIAVGLGSFSSSYSTNCHINPFMRVCQACMTG